MKILSLLLISIIGGSLLSAQDQVPKKANTVIITDTLSMEANFKMVSDLLFESGYGILSSDKESGTISTTEKSFRSGSLKLNFLMKDSRITLRGDFKSNISIEVSGVSMEASWMMIENTGAKNSAYRNAWDELNKIAVQMPGTKEYLVR